MMRDKKFDLFRIKKEDTIHIDVRQGGVHESRDAFLLFSPPPSLGVILNYAHPPSISRDSLTAFYKL